MKKQKDKQEEKQDHQKPEKIRISEEIAREVGLWQRNSENQ